MFKYVHGAKLSIWLRSGAQQSWDEAETSIPGNRGACPAQFRARMERLASTGWLRIPDHMNDEGNGIYAIKARCGLRGYGWFDSHENQKVFVISHVCLKKKQRLDPSDKKRAESERTSFANEREKLRSKSR